MGSFLQRPTRRSRMTGETSHVGGAHVIDVSSGAHYYSSTADHFARGKDPWY